MPGFKDWLRKASGDLKLAMKSPGNDETLDSAIYLTHQCAEKSLKAFFVSKGMVIPRVHDLIVLLNHCVKLDKEFVLLQKACISLDSYGINARYPNDAFRVNQNDLIVAIDTAHQVLSFVSQKVL